MDWSILIKNISKDPFKIGFGSGFGYYNFRHDGLGAGPDPIGKTDLESKPGHRDWNLEPMV